MRKEKYYLPETVIQFTPFACQYQLLYNKIYRSLMYNMMYRMMYRFPVKKPDGAACRFSPAGSAIRLRKAVLSGVHVRVLFTQNPGGFSGIEHVHADIC